jgi:hypothetical protein
MLECRRHDPPTPMREAVVPMHFPRGSLPVRGLRCGSCGHEIVAGPDAQEAWAMAGRLGLFEAEGGRPRKLQKHGNSTTVSLDPAFLRRHGIKAGDSVVVHDRGDELVIRVEEP